MPLYDYQCAKCGAVFEVLQKFSDPPLTQHEGCGGEVTKLLSAPAFQFKGSGWYITDYARGGASSPKTESSTSEAAKSDSSGGSDSKTSTPASTPASTTTKSD